MKNINIPELSIIMPFFNNKELVGEMIDSILANNYKDWELLAIDDGSSENTLEYLEKKYRDKRIRFIKRSIPPKGAQTCRNIGMSKMRGKYVVFFDSDDYITKSCLRTRVESIKQNHKLDFMVFPSAVYINNKFDPNAEKFIYGYEINHDDIKAFARRELPFIVWSNIYRSDSLISHNIKWDTNLLSLQDADFNMQAILSGMRYGYAKVSADYGYRISYSSESLSKKICSEAHHKSNIYATEKFFQMLQAKYGHKYDRAVYQGLLNLYNYIFSDKISHNTAIEMVKCVRRYNRMFGYILKIQVLSTFFLEKIISAKRARQLPMFFYLYNHHKREKRLRKKINPIK